MNGPVPALLRHGWESPHHRNVAWESLAGPRPFPIRMRRAQTPAQTADCATGAAPVALVSLLRRRRLCSKPDRRPEAP
jgi:hypothetical protein